MCHTQLNEDVGLLCTAEWAGGLALEGLSIGEPPQIVVILAVETVADIFCVYCQLLSSDQKKAL